MIRLRVLYELEVRDDEDLKTVLGGLKLAASVLHREVAATEKVRLVKTTMRFVQRDLERKPAKRANPARR